MGRKLFNLEYIKDWLQKNRPEFELCENNLYKGSHGKLNFYHASCNDFVKMSWNHMQGNWGCGICAAVQVGKYNNLAYKFPEFIKEWHPNNKINPEEITYSSNKKVYWICTVCGYGKNKEWFASVNGRTNMNSGCPACANKQQESSLATELKNWCKNKFLKLYHEEQNFKELRSPKNGILKFDIFIEQYSFRSAIFIEIHGHQHYIFTPFWHKTKEEFEYRKKLDKIKKQYAKKHGQYIEIDLRKIKTIKKAIEYIENILKYI